MDALLAISEERFDRAAFVHGFVRMGDMFEVGLEIEGAARLERPARTSLSRSGMYARTGATPPRMPMWRKTMASIGASTPWGMPTLPTIPPGRATGSAVAIDWPVPTQSRAASTLTPSVRSRIARVAASSRGLSTSVLIAAKTTDMAWDS